MVGGEFQGAVEGAEQFAEGLLGGEELAILYEEAFRAEQAACRSDTPVDRESCCQAASFSAAHRDAWRAAKNASWWMCQPHDTCPPRDRRGKYGGREQDFIDLARTTWHSCRNMAGIALSLASPRLFPGLRSEAEAQAVLLREIAGNPFRPLCLATSWLTPTVGLLAESAYQERIMPGGELDSQRLAVLSDALEEAGAVGEVLTHLRSPGPHPRGCWALDMVLERA
ncbi:MAG: hypothetical protein ACRC33_21425 [Gemmataceae bacterium]